MELFTLIFVREDFSRRKKITGCLFVIKNLKLNNVDFVYKIAYDHDRGELFAYCVDNFCYVWDCVLAKIKAKLILDTPGIQIGWHRDETSRVSSVRIRFGINLN
jgi:hypothetical protein